jgi:hypothetical protein
MIGSWNDKLREYARIHVGIDDGIQIPHSVDDRCSCISGFWAGSIDHGSTSWIGHMLWQYYRYTFDEAFLRDTAYPFLRGAFRVYQEMLEQDGGAYRLPFGVSPEFRGGDPDAWGANVSFQLANIHFLCRSLIAASEILGIHDPVVHACRDIRERLPRYASGIGASGKKELFLWEGQPLSESHRHHSHLTGLYPFDIIDAGDPDDKALLKASFEALLRMGMGEWMGWSYPWAAILHARTGNGGMAETLLQIFRRAFLMKGYASSVDAQFPGVSIHDSVSDVMQVEASIAAANALLEMLLHTAHGRLRAFHAVPPLWRNASFSGIRAEGAFLVDGRMEGGTIHCLTVTSEKKNVLRLANPFAGEKDIRYTLNGKRWPAGSDTMIVLEMSAGDTLDIRRRDDRKPAPAAAS